MQGIYMNLFPSITPQNQSKMKPSGDIVAIQKKLSSGMKVDDLSEEEYKKLNAYEQVEQANFYADIQMEMSKAEAIAIKIAKGEELSPEEQKFIDEKYPDIKKDAMQAKKEAEELKVRMQGAKSESERRQILTGAMANVADLAKKGYISDLQVRVKIEAIKKVEEEIEGNQKGVSKIDTVQELNFAPGTFFNKRS